ncbi:adenylate/guanylate cyclase domain-containing protein [Aquibacillus sp. 3ASR75-11]|uniref:Adenylate/guanylate cyclase domain-containing protein n=1 Tax=Terrihalobacillus insolitus TaxID=2950438 RepID=A0A9X4ALH5_9BACI|nr:adenylate/guanylate cyclase domain-containing protein [Terrihalobacillus insolitus]MDC3424256.1 adenylate/guanylate cyclase domain-containing protein [Terrihalobacillus insolitus]
MKSNYRSYNVSNSSSRIKDIVEASNQNFEEVDEIPSREDLTFTNGFYINKTGSIFVDIRKSSELTGNHKRPRLAKIYRSYISEVVALMNSNVHCKEVNIVGDAVSGIFNAQYKNQVTEMVSTASKINTLIKIINYHFRKNGIVEIKIGIGVAYGRSLMIKAGYSGSGINEVVWMGDVVNKASNLCNEANKDTTKPILIGNTVYSNIDDDHLKSLYAKNYILDCYEGNIVNTAMNNWYENNCK